MPQHLAVAFAIESALIVLTVFFLLQPEFAFRNVQPSVKTAFTMGGYTLLCITFCWSVVFGCLKALHMLTYLG